MQYATIAWQWNIFLKLSIQSFFIHIKNLFIIFFESELFVNIVSFVRLLFVSILTRIYSFKKSSLSVFFKLIENKIKQSQEKERSCFSRVPLLNLVPHSHCLTVEVPVFFIFLSFFVVLINLYNFLLTARINL